ncbi:MAG TPA: 6-chlorohydroxyquinol-1,2-dioxygenase, partial [Pseudonocardia sp.]|nr:6-chlorohydroxyquinol-1,2-dioxygenase [Pseudonocardia sp.]
GTALAGAELDVWHAGANGLYDQQDPGVPAWHCRGRYRTGADGRFRIRTVRPVPYHVPTDGRAGELLRAAGRGALRAAHVHARVHAAGHRALTTQWFDLGDAYLKTDATYSVRDGLVRPWAEVTDEAAAAELGVPCPFTRLELEIVLAPGPHDVGDGRA